MIQHHGLEQAAVRSLGHVLTRGQLRDERRARVAVRRGAGLAARGLLGLSLQLVGVPAEAQRRRLLASQPGGGADGALEAGRLPVVHGLLPHVALLACLQREGVDGGQRGRRSAAGPGQ